jgi:hypothetical protein
VPFFNPVFLNQFIDDYLARRAKKIGTTLGFLGNTISSWSGGANTLNIDNACRDYKINFGSADKPQDWVTLLLSLGQTAWHSQDLKVMSSSSSDFCQTMHAIRSYILITLKTSESDVETDKVVFREALNKAIESKIKDIKILREAEEQNLYKLMTATPSHDSAQEKKTNDKINESRAALDNYVRDLAYLGDNYYVLISQRVHKLFYGATYPEANKADLPHVRIKHDPTLKPNPRIPAILHLNYVDMFLEANGKPPLIERKEFESITQRNFETTYNTGASTTTGESPQSGAARGTPKIMPGLSLTISTNSDSPTTVLGSAATILSQLGGSINPPERLMTAEPTEEEEKEITSKKSEKAPVNDAQTEAADAAPEGRRRKR